MKINEYKFGKNNYKKSPKDRVVDKTLVLLSVYEYLFSECSIRENGNEIWRFKVHIGTFWKAVWGFSVSFLIVNVSTTSHIVDAIKFPLPLIQDCSTFAKIRGVYWVIQHNNHNPGSSKYYQSIHCSKSLSPPLHFWRNRKFKIFELSMDLRYLHIRTTANMTLYFHTYQKMPDIGTNIERSRAFR